MELHQIVTRVKALDATEAANMGKEISHLVAAWVCLLKVRTGTDVMILLIFSGKNPQKIGVFDSKQS
jgi:hypothetical protein